VCNNGSFIFIDKFSAESAVAVHLDVSIMAIMPSNQSNILLAIELDHEIEIEAHSFLICLHCAP
jgi:hypothetical protein